jgi:hypothetical protein
VKFQTAILLALSSDLSCDYDLTEVADTLGEDGRNFIISRQIILGLKEAPEIRCSDDQSAHFV